MHITSRFHKPHGGMHWDLALEGLTILVALFFLIFLYPLNPATAQTAEGQTSIPPTAMQAARMPRFAPRLHANPSQNASRLPTFNHPARPTRIPLILVPRRRGPARLQRHLRQRSDQRHPNG